MIVTSVMKELSNYKRRRYVFLSKTMNPLMNTYQGNLCRGKMTKIWLGDENFPDKLLSSIRNYYIMKFYEQKSTNFL